LLARAVRQKALSPLAALKILLSALFPQLYGKAVSYWFGFRQKRPRPQNA